MKRTNLYPLALEALSELSPEIASSRIELARATPGLDDVLAKLEPLPPEALFLGMAEDGLPVLLNLYDSGPGPLLVIGDKGSGKTAFLKSVATVINRTQNPELIQFGVITSSPGDWTGIGETNFCAGIIPIYEKSSMDFVLSLNSWAHANRSNQVVVLLLDGLDKVNQWETNAVDDLRWLLMRGPARRVWPIVTLNSKLKNMVQPFLQHFRTLIYGCVKEEPVSEPQDKTQGADLGTLMEGIQFTMKEGFDWLRFWVPSL